MEPCSGLSSPTSVLRKTDLPVPEGPSMTEISPAGRVSVTSFQMTCEPNDLVRPSTLISTPTASPPASFSTCCREERQGGPQVTVRTKLWRNCRETPRSRGDCPEPVSYTHLRAHETVLDLVCRLLLEKKKK